MRSSNHHRLLTRKGDSRLPFFVSFRRKSQLGFVTVLLLVSLSCGEKSAPPSDFNTIVEDDLGTIVRLTHPPRRIISLAPSLTETLYALGLDSQIAAVTNFCDYPEAARTAPKIGGMTNPSFERIAEINPDVLLMTVSGNERSDYEKLKSLGYNVFVSNPQTLEGVYKSIRDIGLLTGRVTEADSLIATLQFQESYLVRQAKGERPKTVLLLLSLQPLIGVGPHTFIDQLLGHANAHNAAANARTAYPLLSREEVLSLQPDVLVVSSDVGRSLNDVIHAYPEWKSLKAVQTLRVSIVDAALISRPGPRIMLGLQALILAIHT